MKDAEPTPDYIMETLNAYQRTDALHAAIELDLFRAIGRGLRSPRTLVEPCGASERGLRILCDYLVVQGLLTKEGKTYGLTEQASRFLDRGSKDYIGGAVGFLGSDLLRHGFGKLTEAVRRGGTAHPGAGALRPEHEAWVDFARTMAPVMSPAATALAELTDTRGAAPRKILDLAAGHGLFGIAMATRYAEAAVFAVDWPNVLAVAEENARTAGIAGRYHTLPGDVLCIDVGSGYDVVVLANLLHHFDASTCVELLRKVARALNGNGRALLLECIPDEDRVSPPRAAGFALVMLATTPAGDAYTFAEYREMLREAGLANSRLLDLPGSFHRVVEGTAS